MKEAKKKKKKKETNWPLYAPMHQSPGNRDINHEAKKEREHRR